MEASRPAGVEIVLRFQFPVTIQGKRNRAQLIDRIGSILLTPEQSLNRGGNSLISCYCTNPTKEELQLWLKKSTILHFPPTERRD